MSQVIRVSSTNFPMASTSFPWPASGWRPRPTPTCSPTRSRPSSSSWSTWPWKRWGKLSVTKAATRSWPQVTFPILHGFACSSIWFGNWTRRWYYIQLVRRTGRPLPQISEGQKWRIAVVARPLGHVHIRSCKIQQSQERMYFKKLKLKFLLEPLFNDERCGCIGIGHRQLHQRSV